MRHIEIAKAWLDGKPIQVKDEGGSLRGKGDGKWHTLMAPTELMGVPNVSMYHFHDEYEYRIKPETVKYRRYLRRCDGRAIVCVISERSSAADVESYPSFIRWIDTDWQEEEI